LELGHFHEFDSIRSEELPRTAGWFATRVRFELVLAAIGVEFPCPRLKRKFANFGRPWFAWSASRAGEPETRFSRKRAETHAPAG
jgi:hypothetical protein